ncbi:hypothetical protein J0X14_04535 [Muricauda sp. CAU 1633]|uniref:hypothetical protein n=1 Tax=Allomuricauda sp. CAU 1633 TaxID=2816036 RepID=UPI001A8C7A1C|nr:hypothetical protein [Muricauda sp. CAU 1633]MBO0321556.1 hypothetical protein [Muricauda sp. CAU 1633]
MQEITITAELKSHFLRLYQIALSDDNFDVLEMQMLYEFAKDRGVSKEQLNNLLLSPTNQSAIPETQEKRVEYLYDLAVMIWADGKVTEDEYNTLKKYCKKFEFLEDNIVQIVDFLLESAKNKKGKEEILKNLNT